MEEQFVIISNGTDIIIVDASEVSYHYRYGFTTELSRFDSYEEALQFANRVSS